MFHLLSWELLSAFHLGYKAPPAYAATLLPLDLQWHLMSQIGLMKDTDRSCETSLVEIGGKVRKTSLQHELVI